MRKTIDFVYPALDCQVERFQETQLTADHYGGRTHLWRCALMSQSHTGDLSTSAVFCAPFQCVRNITRHGLLSLTAIAAACFIVILHSADHFSAVSHLTTFHKSFSSGGMTSNVHDASPQSLLDGLRNNKADFLKNVAHPEQSLRSWAMVMGE